MADFDDAEVSVVIPCRNEARALPVLLERIRRVLPGAEILVVDDGSTDGSHAICAEHGVRCVRHPYRKGNGAAIKTGARAAFGKVIVFMDGDGQHSPEDVPRLIELISRGYDLAVGARQPGSHASWLRGRVNAFYNRFASAMTGYEIRDLTSGFRAVRAEHFRRVLYLLPNGFSYPTTSTMAFYRYGLSVGFVPVTAQKRIGKSHIHPIRDGFRFIIIILKVGTLFSPMRLFLPISAFLFLLGFGYYLYTYFVFGRFTNMGAVMFLSALFVMLIGLVSEQIGALHYRGMDELPHGNRERVAGELHDDP